MTREEFEQALQALKPGDDDQAVSLFWQSRGVQRAARRRSPVSAIIASAFGGDSSQFWRAVKSRPTPPGWKSIAQVLLKEEEADPKRT